MARKYVFKEEGNIKFNVVSFIEEDFLKVVTNLELVDNFDKDTLLIAFSQGDFCKNIKTCHKNLILVTNEYDINDAAYIKSNGDYNTFAIDTLNNFITLMKQAVINIDVDDINSTLKHKEFNMVNIVEQYDMCINTLKEISNNIQILDNVDTVLFNIIANDKLTLLMATKLIDSLKLTQNFNIHLIFGTSLNKNLEDNVINIQLFY